MNDKKIDQILKNQATILVSLSLFKEIDLETIHSIEERLNEIKGILIPTKSKEHSKDLPKGSGLSDCCEAPILIKRDLCSKCGKNA